MIATLVAQAAPQLTAEQWIDQTQKRLELMRVAATILELQDSRHPNERLIAWYQGRRKVLARELGL